VAVTGAKPDTRHQSCSDASTAAPVPHSFIHSQKNSPLLITRLALFPPRKVVPGRHNNKIKSSCESTVRHHWIPPGHSNPWVDLLIGFTCRYLSPRAAASHFLIITTPLHNSDTFVVFWSRNWFEVLKE